MVRVALLLAALTLLMTLPVATSLAALSSFPVARLDDAVVFKLEALVRR